MRRYKNRSRRSSENEWCLEWLKLNRLEHILDKVIRSGVDIEKLSESDNLTIRETASYKMKLRGDDLSLFVASVRRYHNLESLYKRNEEVSSCLSTLEFTKKELDIKRQHDTVYIAEKFKKMIKALQRRQDQLVGEIEKKSTAKQQELDDQMDSLRGYQSKLQSQHELLLQSKVEQILVDEASERALDALNFDAKVLLNEAIEYDRHRFARINKVSVEVPNFDEMVSQIKSLGNIEDEFDRYSSTETDHTTASTLRSSHSVNGHPPDTELQCPCGSPLMLTNVDFAYSAGERVFCQKNKS